MNALNATLRTQKILWSALTLAPLAYLGVALSAPQTDAAAPPLILPVLGAVAAMTAALSFILPEKLFASALHRRVGHDLRITQVASSAPVLAEGGFRDASPSVNAVEDPVAALTLAAQLDMSPLIITLALRESIAIHGLVLAMLGFSMRVAFGFIAVSVALMILRRPSLEALRARVEQAIDARVPSPQG
ncbi:MAG: hypothetical protein R3A48_20010 [Polyangiales bacterium]